MKSKKSLKGMTLVEIIIAMAILAIAGSVLCTTCICISRMKVTTNALTKRISYEAPVADCKIYQVISYDSSGNEVITQYANSAGTGDYDVYTYNDDGTIDTDKTKVCNSQLTVSDGSNNYTVDGYLYEVDGDNVSDYGSGDNGNGVVSITDHNFKFFVIGGIDKS